MAFGETQYHLHLRQPHWQPRCWRCIGAEILFFRQRYLLSLYTPLVHQIETLALMGRGMSRLNAMQSLAKIVHSLSIRDLSWMKKVSVHEDDLVMILRIKARALQCLWNIQAKDETVKSSPSKIAILYASYLLWWLGMCSYKQALLFSIYKAARLTAQIAFMKEIYEIILEAIRCPDKPGFRMFYGDFEIWANEFTADCFSEFIRQFRLLSKSEPLKPFLDQLNNFHLEGISSLDLSNKALTANETQAILQVLSKKMIIKDLNLNGNLIGDKTGQIVFPDSLLSLNLQENYIDDLGSKELHLPLNLQDLSLWSNRIGKEGAKRIQFPENLQSLNLGSNRILDEGAKGLQIPKTLKSLNLWGNEIGDEGAEGLQLPEALQSLGLGSNNIGEAGAVGLRLPQSLKVLDLSSNELGDEGAKGLKLPSTLQSLYLGRNEIGEKGVKGLLLPKGLQSLSLDSNDIGDEGIPGLQFPQALQFLDLGDTLIGQEGAKALRLPQTLQELDLSVNQVGNEGAKGLQLPQALQKLNLGSNQIGADGAKGLRLPQTLQRLFLGINQIGDEGAKALRLPPTLRSINLDNNKIGGEGAKGLQLPPNLQSLELGDNQIGNDGAKAIRFPQSLQDLDLSGNHIDFEGVKGLQLPQALRSLNLCRNWFGDEGVEGLQLPQILQILILDYNQIGDLGVKALLQKIPSTNLTTLDLRGNKYNVSVLNEQRVLQQQKLLRLCQDKLCHANTPLQFTEELQTSTASRTATPFFSWLNKPMRVLAERINVYFSAFGESLDSGFTNVLRRIRTSLHETLSDCPSYFPNINSPVFHDHHPPGPLSMTHSQHLPLCVLQPGKMPIALPHQFYLRA